MAHPKVMIVASDSASDFYGGALVERLRDQIAGISILGIGGRHMRELGVDLLYDTSELDRLGVFHSIKGAHVVKRLIIRLSDAMERLRPDVVVQVGEPLFNYRLVELARSKGFPVVYYFTPLSLGISDVKLAPLAKSITKVAAVTRYEYRLCLEADIDTEFVGHPLVDLARSTMTPLECRSKWGLSRGSVIALLPGSKDIEVKSMLPIMVKVLSLLRRSHEDLQAVLSLAPGIRDGLIDPILGDRSDVTVVSNTYDVLNLATVAIVTCGNTGLDAALMGTPAVAVYRVPSTTYLFDRMLAKRSHLAVPNFLAKQAIIPELTKGELTEKRLAQEVDRLLSDAEARQRMVAQYQLLTEELGTSGTIDRAVSVICSVMDGAVGHHG